MEKDQDICSVVCINEENVNKVRHHLISDEETQRLADTFKAMGDPTRIKLIQALSIEELCVCDLAALLNMTQSAISHQLRVLRNMRLVKYRREGKIVYYSLDDSHIVNLFTQGLDHVRHI